METIILAAGQGVHGHLPQIDLPKGLLKAGNMSILERILYALDRHEMAKTTIIVGYQADKIIQQFGNRFKDMPIEYIINDIYHKTNNMYSLWKANKILEQGALIIEDDIVEGQQLPLEGYRWSGLRLSGLSCRGNIETRLIHLKVYRSEKPKNGAQ